MSRATEVFTYLTLFITIWLLLLYNIIPLPTSSSTFTSSISFYITIFQHHILPFLPLYLLISFGCYSLGVIGYSLMTFNECPSAYKELETDIQNARKRLIQRGFKFLWNMIVMVWYVIGCDVMWCDWKENIIDNICLKTKNNGENWIFLVYDEFFMYGFMNVCMLLWRMKGWEITHILIPWHRGSNHVKWSESKSKWMNERELILNTYIIEWLIEGWSFHGCWNDYSVSQVHQALDEFIWSLDKTRKGMS